MKEMKDLENSKNPIINELIQEIKAKRRIQINALFYFSFYLFGATIVSNTYGHTFIVRMGFLAFLFIPNIIFYQKKFKNCNTKIEEILLKHSLSKVVIVRDKELVNKFIQDYLNFYSINKLI